MDVERMLTVSIYTFLIMCFVLVAMVGWGFTHGG